MSNEQNRYGDGTVFEGIRSKDSVIPTLELQFTPGPWKIGAIESGRMAVDGANDEEVTGWIDPEDAYLIAAAPELYEALDGLLADITEYQEINNLGGQNNHWQVKAKAALAKARGEG